MEGIGDSFLITADGDVAECSELDDFHLRVIRILLSDELNLLGAINRCARLCCTLWQSRVLEGQSIFQRGFWTFSKGMSRVNTGLLWMNPLTDGSNQKPDGCGEDTHRLEPAKQECQTQSMKKTLRRLKDLYLRCALLPQG